MPTGIPPDALPVIAVDAMGGDHAPGAVVEGALAAARTGHLAVTLVGPEPVLADILAQHDTNGLTLRVVHAPDVVTMAERPLVAFRRKSRSSIRVAAELVSLGEATAMFTAGNSGVAVLAAHAVLGTIVGVERPALAVHVPTRLGAAVLLDVGANVDCRPEHLVEFARLGAAYATATLRMPTPRVGLLSIGEEEGKGNDLIRDVDARLRASALAYIGNLEARDLFTGKADVAVCDGFTGNIALKIGEGLVEAVDGMAREAFAAEDAGTGDPGLAERVLDRLAKRLDAAEYGAAPLLGIDGLVLVGHGRSSPRAVASGIVLAARLARTQLVQQVQRAMVDVTGTEGVASA